MERTKETKGQAIPLEMDEEDAEFLWQHGAGLDLSALPTAQGTFGGGFVVMEEIQGKQA